VGLKPIVGHIDRLILKGFRNEDRHAIAAALQRELVRLWAGSIDLETLAPLDKVVRIRAGRINLVQNAKPHQAGISAAGAIERGVKS
jgi:hypothetical protein